MLLLIRTKDENSLVLGHLMCSCICFSIIYTFNKIVFTQIPRDTHLYSVRSSKPFHDSPPFYSRNRNWKFPFDWTVFTSKPHSFGLPVCLSVFSRSQVKVRNVVWFTYLLTYRQNVSCNWRVTRRRRIRVCNLLRKVPQRDNVGKPLHSLM